jgi:hypothetical protein
MRAQKILGALRNNFPRAGIYKGMSTDVMPLPDPAMLPDDPAVLKQLVVQLLEELRKANARLERQEHHMHLLLKRIYGSTSEKFDRKRPAEHVGGNREPREAVGGPENDQAGFQRWGSNARSSSSLAAGSMAGSRVSTSR